MRSRTSALLLSAALTCNASAQTVDEVIARAIQARGGANKMSAIGALRATGTIRLAQNAPDAITVLAKRPNYFRVDIDSGGDHTTQGYDGVTGWQMVTGAHSQAPTKLSGAALNHLIDQASNAIDGPLLDYRARNIRTALAGHVTSHSKDCYLVRVTLPTGTLIEQYLDASTYLEIQEDSPSIPMKQTVSDYKSYAGVLFPSLYESESQRLELADREVNPRFDSALFAMPKP